MFILINRDQLIITHKHLSKAALVSVASIEMEASKTFICDEMNVASFNDLTDLELILIHLNMCGQEFESLDRDALVRAVRGICHSMYESNIDGFEAAKQSMSIPDGETRQYVPGSPVPRGKG